MTESPAEWLMRSLPAHVLNVPVTPDPATSHKCHRSGESWKITAPLDCESTNVIYKLACRKCREFVYIGETKRKFCQRLADHRGYIERKVLNHPVGNHFNQPGHDVTDLIPLPIEKVFPEGNHQLRKQREKYWIQKYDSVCNGANSREWKGMNGPTQ